MNLKTHSIVQMKLLFYLFMLMSLSCFSQQSSDEEYFREAVSLSRTFVLEEEKFYKDIKDTINIRPNELNIGVFKRLKNNSRYIFKVDFKEEKMKSIVLLVNYLNEEIILMKSTATDMSNGAIVIQTLEKHSAFYFEFSDYLRKDTPMSSLYSNVNYIMRLNDDLFPKDKMKISNNTIEYFTDIFYEENDDINIYDGKLVELLYIPIGAKTNKDLEEINTFFKLKKCFMNKPNMSNLCSIRPYIRDEYLIYPLWYFGKYKYR